MRWLTKCCCCITLQTGSLLAGSWTLFIAALNISLQVINIMSMENVTSYQVKHGHIQVRSRKILASLEMCFGVALAAVSLLLFFAVIKGRRKLLFPYVVAILLYNIFDFSTLMFYFGKGVQIDSSLWIPDLAILCMNMYCLLTVLSLNNEMTKGERWVPIDQIDSAEF